MEWKQKKTEYREEKKVNKKRDVVAAKKQTSMMKLTIHGASSEALSRVGIECLAVGLRTNFHV